MKSAVLRKPLKDEVYSDLQESILSGRYAAGAWLRQDEIARRLGVSMTPVREALDLLVSSGLAERVAYRGVRVLQLSNPDILDAYEMRLLLEAAAAYRAAAAISPEDLRRLRHILAEEAELADLGQLPRHREVSRALHTAIVAAAGNPLLSRLYIEVLRSFPDWMLYEHLYRHPETIVGAACHEHREHELIVDALDAGDPVAAVRQAVDHVRRRGAELETYVGIPRAALAAREEQVYRLIPEALTETEVPNKERT